MTARAASPHPEHRRSIPVAIQLYRSHHFTIYWRKGKSAGKSEAAAAPAGCDAPPAAQPTARAAGARARAPGRLRPPGLPVCPRSENALRPAPGHTLNPHTQQACTQLQHTHIYRQAFSRDSEKINLDPAHTAQTHCTGTSHRPQEAGPPQTLAPSTCTEYSFPASKYRDQLGGAVFHCFAHASSWRSCRRESRQRRARTEQCHEHVGLRIRDGSPACRGNSSAPWPVTSAAPHSIGPYRSH